MKNTFNLYFANFLIFLFLIGIFGCTHRKAAKDNSPIVYAKIDSLLETKNYFDARDTYQKKKNELSTFHKLKVGVFLDYAFNKGDSSLIKSALLLSHYSSQLSDSVKYKIESIAHVNHSRQYAYKMAKESLEKLLHTYSDFISEEKRNDLENTLVIWTLLQDQPKQKVIKHRALDVPIIRDKAGLQNLQITNGDFKRNFVFDTGANISTISLSTAKEFEVVFLEGSFKVNSITGQRVDSRVGIVPSLFIGDIEVKNAVFLIFPDAALSFPQIDYQIDGILGFPVLEALVEIQITGDDRFMVPLKQSNSEDKNFAIDFLTPLLWLEDDLGKGVYSFDTGASKTMLYDTYYLLHEDALNNTTEETDYSFGGAGGHITKKGIHTTFTPSIHNRIVQLDSIMVLKEPIHPNNHFLGNIGQDLIGNFDKITINFDQMFIRFDSN